MDALSDGASAPAAEGEIAEQKTEKDPFDEIDFGTFFDDYLDPGYKSPASETVEKPSFETFLSSPVTLADHLHSQLAVLVMSEDVRDAADNIIGNLNENGYLTATLEEIADSGQHPMAEVQEALRIVQIARSGRRGRHRCPRMPAVADREPQRQGRGGLADCRQSFEAARNPPDQGNRQSSWAGRWSMSRWRWM